MTAATVPLSQQVKETLQTVQQITMAAGHTLECVSAAQELTTELRMDVEGALCKQVPVAQAQTKEETERLRWDIKDVLHTLLSTA